MEFSQTEWLILSTLEANEHKPIQGATLFQKILFLIGQNNDKIFNSLDFKSHRLGPYSEPVVKAIEDLEKIGLIKKTGNLKKMNEKTIYEITEKGVEELKIFNDVILDREQLIELNDIIETVKEDFEGFTYNEILAFIYKIRPQYIGNSLVANNLKYEKIFAKMIKEDKIGIGKVAELLKCSREQILNIFDMEK